MANAMYDHARENFILGNMDWVDDDHRIMFIDEGVDVPDIAVDEDLDDRTVGAIEGTSANMASEANVGGVCDAADITVATVTGETVESIDLYKETGVAGTSLLICNIDTCTGLAFTPNGGDVTVAWDAGANKIFAWNNS